MQGIPRCENREAAIVVRRLAIHNRQKKADAEAATAARADAAAARAGRGLTEADIWQNETPWGGPGVAPVAVRPAVAFEEGDEVTVPGPKKGAPRLTGLITEMLAKHAWVTLAVGQGPKSGQRNRVALKAIKAVEQPAPVTTAAATAASRWAALAARTTV